MANVSTMFVALAALCWGLSGGIGGILMADGWDAFVVSFYRGAVGLLFVLAWLAFHPYDSGLKNRRLWFWSIIAGLGIAGNFAFYFLSIAEGSVAVAATLMYCAPVFVYLVSFIFRFEKPTALKWTAIALVLLGIVLLTGLYDIGASGVTPRGVGAGLLAGLSYTLFIFGLKYAARYGSPPAILAIAFTVLVAILTWPSGTAQIVAVLDTPSWPLFAVLGVLGAGISFILYVIGLHHTTPATTSIVAMVEPVTAALFGVMVLKESLDGVQLFGMVLILLPVTALGAFSTPDGHLALRLRKRG